MAAGIVSKAGNRGVLCGKKGDGEGHRGDNRRRVAKTLAQLPPVFRNLLPIVRGLPLASAGPSRWHYVGPVPSAGFPYRCRSWPVLAP